MMIAKFKNNYTQFGYNFPLLISFLLPFGINYSIIIIFWAIGFFIFDDVKAGIKHILKNKWSLVFLAFFFTHLGAYFFSDNKNDALTAIEIKLSFLVFPLLIFATNYTAMQVKKICISFVSGCVLVSVFYVFRANYLYFFENSNAFFYTEFTYFMHPSYYAMYLIFSLFIITLYYYKWLNHLSHLNIKIGFIVFLFITCLFLASSKMGLITAFILLPIVLTIKLYKSGYQKMIFGLMIAFCLGLALCYKIFPHPFERLKVAVNVTSSSQIIDKTSAESTAVRILIWKECITLIKQNFLLGVTPGDTNDALVKAYTENGLTGALKKELNAHNQFLQTFLGTGLIGFILLLCMTFGTIIYGILKKNYAIVFLSILCILNFLVESMLQAQAGFIFFVFFSCILLQYNLAKMSSNNS